MPLTQGSWLRCWLLQACHWTSWASAAVCRLVTQPALLSKRRQRLLARWVAATEMLLRLLAACWGVSSHCCLQVRSWAPASLTADVVLLLPMAACIMWCTLSRLCSPADHCMPQSCTTVVGCCRCFPRCMSYCLRLVDFHLCLPDPQPCWDCGISRACVPGRRLVITRMMACYQTTPASAHFAAQTVHQKACKLAGGGLPA